MTGKFPEAFQQIEEIEAVLCRWHAKASQACRVINRSLDNSRGQVLVESIVSRQEALSQLYAGSPKVTEASVMSTWIQFTPYREIEERFLAIQQNPSSSLELATRIHQLETAIVQFIQTIQDQTESSNCKAQLVSLADLELGEAKFLARAITEFADA